MSDWERFTALINDDRELQRRLWEHTDVQAFAADAVRIAAEHEIILTFGEVLEVCGRGRHALSASWMP